MTANDFHLNRPIHLARRDIYFERALELLLAPMQEMDTPQRIRRLDRVLALLKTANLHATFAGKTTNIPKQEQDFLRFIGLISRNVQSAHAMMQHESHFEHEEGFLCHFLNATPEECAIPALHYRRRADDIMQGVWHLLRLAHPAVHALLKLTEAELEEADRARYHKAYQSFRAEVMERFPAEEPADPAAAR